MTNIGITPCNVINH